MLQSMNRLRRGFTLVEIMIVVAIIALLAAIAVPNFLRARKRTQATRILNDLRILDHALDHYALETHKGLGDTADWSDLKSYLKEGTALYNSERKDLLGGTYGGFTVDFSPKLDETTYNKLSDVAPDGFWSPYYP